MQIGTSDFDPDIDSVKILRGLLWGTFHNIIMTFFYETETD